MPKSFVEQALARCSVKGSKLWFNCNPDSSEHWFFKEMYSGVFYDRYIRGLWVLAEGLVYPMFNKSRHIVENCTLTTNVAYYISVDYGTLNPCSMGLWAKKNDHAIDDIRYFCYTVLRRIFLHGEG